MRIDEQRAQLELAQLQREPVSPPPSSCGAAASATGPTGDGQYRAMAAALQLKNTQMRAGIERDELADSALIFGSELPTPKPGLQQGCEGRPS